MSLIVDYHIEGRRLVATVTGEFDPDESVERFAAVLAACLAHDLGEVLVDYRDLTGRGSAVQEIIYATTIVDLYRSYRAAEGGPLRFAYVGNDDFIAGWVPGAQVAESAGMDVFVTTDFAAALEWLDTEG